MESIVILPGGKIHRQYAPTMKVTYCRPNVGFGSNTHHATDKLLAMAKPDNFCKKCFYKSEIDALTQEKSHAVA